MPKKPASTTVTLARRARGGTTGARAARRDGQLPGVLYGHGDPVAIQLDHASFHALVAAGAKTHAVSATLDGAPVSVLLRAVTHEPIGRAPLAVDLQRVERGETISASVPVHTVGTSVGVKDFGGILELVTAAVDVKGPADRIPEALEVDVAGLGLHEHIDASALRLPAGITLVTSPETTIVSIVANRAVVESGPETPEPTEAPTA